MLAFAAIVAVLCSGAAAATRIAGAQTSSAASIASVVNGDRALTIGWIAPGGVGEADVIAYDLRYIETSADETIDANWSPVIGAWTEGPLHYLLAGLTNEVDYEVQLRARTFAATGEWSASVLGRPDDHGRGPHAASTIPLESPVGGYIDPSTDEEWFQLIVPSRVDVQIYTTGTTKLQAMLMDHDGIVIDNGVEAEYLSGANNSFIQRTLQSGSYYVAVESKDGDEGAFVLHTRIVTVGTSFGRAVPIEVNSDTYGALIAHQQDFYRFDLDTATDLLIRTTGLVADTVGAVYDADRQLVAANDDGYLAQRLDFAIRVRLEAGISYLTVRGYGPRHVGVYALHVHEVDEPGSTPASASPLQFGGAEAATIASGTEDYYFRVEIPETTLVMFRAVSRDAALDAAVLDANLNEVAGAVTVDHQGPSGRNGFGVSAPRELTAGTHYFRVSSDTSESGGSYIATVYEDLSYRAMRLGCGPSQTGFSDPLFGCQWNLQNTGQTQGTYGADINVVDAWSTTMGSEEVNIAIVDTKVDYSHQDLVENLDVSMSHDYGADVGAVSNPGYHGTAVAGIVAARDNIFGIRGVAPRATLRSFNLLDAYSVRNEADAATRHAATNAVSNNSWGPTDNGQPHRATRLWEMAIESGLTVGEGGRGTSYVWAAGNGGTDDDSNLDPYSNFWGVTAACAVNHVGEPTWYSEPGANLWVCAPSKDRPPAPSISSTNTSGRYTSEFGGTSAAAPQVSGVIALIRSVNPLLTWRDVKLILAGSARKNDENNAGWLSGAVKYETSADEYSFNHMYGFGVVDADAAVKLAQNWIAVPELAKESGESASDVMFIRDGETAEQSIVLGKEVEFAEFVEVNVVMDAPNLRSLDLELVSPTGAVSELLMADVGRGYPAALHAADGAYRLGSARHLGEDPSGRWTFRVIDRESGGGASRLQSWSITVYGHRQVPGPPSITEIDGESDPLTVTWEPPRSAGRTSVTSYDLRYIKSDSVDKADDTAWWLINSATTPATFSYTITGLAPGISHDVEVRAVNDQGAGAWSQSLRGQVGESNAVPHFAAAENGLRAITENSPLGTEIGEPLLVSNDDSSHLAFALSGVDATAFEIDAQGQLRTNQLIDYETQHRHSFQINVVDEAGHSDRLQASVNVIDVNERPALAGDSARSYYENDDDSVGRYIATDPEIDDLTWSLSGPDAEFFVLEETAPAYVFLWLFWLDPDTRHVLLRFVDPPDFESPDDLNKDNVYQVTLEVSDPVNTVVLHMQVDVKDRNEAPELNGRPSAPHDEHDTADTAQFIATDPEGDHIRWSLTGTDAALFSIVGGSLRFVEPPDFEAPEDRASVPGHGDSIAGDNRYDVKVHAHDDASSSSLNVTVVVTNVDELPTITLTSLQPLVGETITTTLTDPDGDVRDLAWSWQNSADGSVWSEIAGATTASYRPVAADDGRYLRVSASYDDGHGVDKLAHREIDGSVGLSEPTNHPASFGSDATIRRSVAENSPAGTSVGAPVTAVDIDRDSLAYSLGGDDAGLFDIVATTGQIRTINVHDYEDPRRYSLTVSVTDGKDADGNADTLIDASIPVTVVISDVDEAPTLSGLTMVLRDEGEGDRRGTEFVAIDPENRHLSWELSGADAGVFNIGAGGALTFKYLTDFEFPRDSDRDNKYVARVSVSDGLHEKGLDVSIDVANVNEPPSFWITSMVSVSENVTFVRQLYPGDPEGTEPIWSLSGTDAGSFKISQFNILMFRSPPDYEKPSDLDGNSIVGGDNFYDFAISLGDGEFTYTRPITVIVTNADDPPVIDGDTSPKFEEGRTGTVATYSAEDPEDISVSWSLGGIDEDSFELSADGDLTFTRTPDYESPGDTNGDNDYQVEMNASDGFNTTTAHVTVSIENVDEPGTLTLSSKHPQTDAGLSASLRDPDGISATSVTWSWERSSTSTPTWTGVTDANAHTYTPKGLDVGYRLRATASYRDGHGGNKSADSEPTEAVQAAPPTNQAPVFLASELGTREVTENAAPGYVGAPFNAVDNDRLTYSLVQADTDVFHIDSSSGQLSSLVSLDYEYEPSYTFKVRAEDPSGDWDQIQVTVFVVNVDEPPTLRGPKFANVAEASSRLVARFTADDPERAAVSWSSGGTDADAFEIADGALRFLNVPDYENPADHEKDNLYVVTVIASDGNLETYRTVRVSVVPVDEAPVISGGFAVDVPENTIAVGVYRATDPEGGHVITTLEGDDSDALILHDDGTLVFVQAPDYERPTGSTVPNRFEFELVANDGRNVTTQDVTIRITNEVDLGTVTLSTNEPVIGVSISAVLADPDGSVSAVSWQWSTSEDGVDWTDIDRATSSHYTPADDDEGLHLRATATYTDVHGPLQTANADSEDPVRKPADPDTGMTDPLVTRPVSDGGNGGGGGTGGGGTGGGGGFSESTATLIVANGWSPSDIGAAAALAARTADSAVIYTSGDRLSAAARDLLTDYLPAAVVVVGGEAAVSAETLTAIRRASEVEQVSRITGATRVDTAAEVARTILNTSRASPGGTTVILANGWSPPDIGVAAALAARTPSSAVVYTQQRKLPEPTVHLLDTFRPSRVIIVGGETVVSAEVEAMIGSVVPGAFVERISGPTRTGTAAGVSRRFLGSPESGVFDNLTIIVANGWSPPDIGLAAALSARTTGSTVLYTEAGRLSPEAEAVLHEYQPARIVFIGGPAAITDDAKNRARSVVPDAAAPRYSGSTRTQTAAFVARRILGNP